MSIDVYSKKGMQLVEAINLKGEIVSEGTGIEEWFMPCPKH